MEYKRYGDEWAKEVVKNNKETIASMLRNVCLERDTLTAEVERLQRIEQAAHKTLVTATGYGMFQKRIMTEECVAELRVALGDKA